MLFQNINYSPFKQQCPPHNKTDTRHKKNHNPDFRTHNKFLKNCIHLLISILSTEKIVDVQYDGGYKLLHTCCCRPKSSLHITHGWDESCLAFDVSLIFLHSLSERRSSGASTRPSFWAVKKWNFLLRMYMLQMV